MAAVDALTRNGSAGGVHAWDSRNGARQREAAGALGREGVKATHGDNGIALLDGPPAPQTVVKSPGLPPSAPILDAAARRGLAVIDEAELGWRLDPRPLLAVAGTNGKSTTVSLVAAVLSADGRSPISAGNTTFGVPYSTAADRPGDVIISEFSSFQLEGCPELLPDAAVFANLTHDHLYRHRTVEEYENCKRRLFIRDAAAVPAAAIGIDQECGRKLARDLRELGSTVVTFGNHPEAQRRVIAVGPELGGGEVQIAEGFSTRTIRSRLTGSHNALNVAGALALADALGIAPATAASAIEETDALPGRYERLLKRSRVRRHRRLRPQPRRGRAGSRRRSRDRESARPWRASRRALDADHGRARAGACGRPSRRRACRPPHPDDPSLDARQPPDRLPDGLRGSPGDLPGHGEVKTDRARAIERALRAAGPGDLVLILERGERDSLVYDRDDRGRRFDDRDEVRALLASLDA